MKRNRNEMDEEKLSRLSGIINGLAVVYGPIKVENLLKKIREYFPGEYEEEGAENLEALVRHMEEIEVFYISSEDEVSLFDEEELENLMSLEELKPYLSMPLQKRFKNPEDIVRYGQIFDLKGIRELDDLRAFLNGLKYKKGSNSEEAYAEALTVIAKMYDENQYITQLRMRLSGRLDEKRLLALMDRVGLIFPRGFLHGYSFLELNEDNKGDLFSLHSEKKRIEMPLDYRLFGVYSYRDCLSLAMKLGKTQIFEQFCSDNVMELQINGKEVFIQLLGYYNGDRNLIIYGDRKNLEYNYQFLFKEEESYPDILSRISYHEIAMDDPGNFDTPELRRIRLKKGYPKSPLIFELNPLEGPVLPEQDALDEIGAVLDSLLSIYDQTGSGIGECCREGDTSHVVQYYLRENGNVERGDYTYEKLGETILPFKVEEISKDRTISAKKKSDIEIGIYAMPVLSEEKPCYLTIVFDGSSGLISGFKICKEEEMSDMANQAVDMLEKAGIRPRSLTFNNSFAYAVLKQLCRFYIVNYQISSQQLDELYDHVMNENMIH